MTATRWEILCLTMPSRTDFLARLRACLGPQLAGLDGTVTFTVAVSDPALSLGENRERMRRASCGDYINFVDDDDLVAEDYVERIFPLLDGVDYVGFRLQAYEDGVPLPGPTYHSLLCGGWFDKTYADGTRSWHRDISQLNPMRRELSLTTALWGGFGEDSRWAGELRSKKIVKTEHYVEDIMYHYLSRPNKTDGRLEVKVTVGVCPHCRSDATVMSGGVKYCNACGGTFR